MGFESKRCVLLDKIFAMIEIIIGVIQRVQHTIRGEGVDKKVTESDAERGRWGTDISHSKYFVSIFL